ncbi:enoyl-[acyl-carrier-protein] reductase, mitochondrial isoform X2 [Pieris napi]|uniref:enoyl-[acyl-carrier-protein] reductase, mitochondrial isoform X2 n=1 Tax=Pieris napi TaxID=78633 RepID=UPI001FBB0D7D|nr:enoyl-[acyl-carrier-protein] reductase, mitochondrial isoform X2 [Pieris napi]
MKFMTILHKATLNILKPKQFSYHVPIWNQQLRNLMSRQLVYKEFGDPLHVVKYRECEVPPLGKQEVLVRMLAAPVNPADINTIQGRYRKLPKLPTVPGDEGVGNVVEIGSHVCTVEPGERVVLTSRMLGTWRYYGIYNERDVHVVSPKLGLPEACMLTIAPCMAYRMLRDFSRLKPGDTIIQNAANSPCGQSVIQLCKAWGLQTINIVANHCGYDAVKKNLMSLGATAVYTIDEAETISTFNTSLTRPVLAFNCLGGRFEDVMLKLLECNGSIVYYGCAYDFPMVKSCLRPDLSFNVFHLADWNARATPIEIDIMMNNIVNLMVTGEFKAPIYQPVELKHFVHALRHTVHCEAFSTVNYVFDFTMP